MSKVFKRILVLIVISGVLYSCVSAKIYEDLKSNQDSLKLENSGIPKDNLTAAGRSEYVPIGTNDTYERRAKNRRIEVVLTSKLDEINKLLNET